MQFLLDKWGDLLGEDIIRRILRAIDFVREEVIRQHGGSAIFIQTLKRRRMAERMQNTKDIVSIKNGCRDSFCIAKNSYVWLEQLSRKYKCWIKTLDQIPDEELDLLRDRGFTGLWLIGLWERSRASQRMKQRMGDPDAVASAYSLQFI